jgi:hypothetical protein
MVIDQRNAGASITPTISTYSVDRWYAYISAASKFSVQQNAGAVTPPEGFTNYIGITSTSAYAINSGDYFGVSQAIEGFNTADLGWGTANAKPITLSFWARSSLTGTFSVSIRNYGLYNRGYAATYTINAANTWEYKTITIAGDTSGTWTGGTNNGSLICSWGVGTGSTYSFAANSWQSNNVIAATGTVSVVGTSGATFYLTGVQLERGTVATPFEFRSIGQEFSLCERYYEVQNVDVSMPFPAICYANGVTAVAYTRFRTKKRAAPSVTYSGAARMVFPSNIGGSSGTLIANVINTDATQTNSTTTISTASAGWFDNYSMFASSEL